MKPKYFIVILVFCIGCTGSDSSKQRPEVQEKIVYQNIPEEHLGLWVAEKYIHALSESRSTKKAGELNLDMLYQIDAPSNIISMNLHEGGADNLLLMSSKNNGQIFSSDSLNAYEKVLFEDNELIIDEEKFIHANNGLEELVNEVILAGTYSFNGKSIEMKRNGTFVGFDAITNYKLNLDYVDAGMQFDKIYFQFDGESEPRTYLYEFVSDTLVIREIDCLTLDETNNYCLEVEKGKVVYEFIKKSDSLSL